MAKRIGSPHDFPNDVLRCPDCQGELSFLGSWTVRGPWGYKEVRTYECPSHGPTFVGSERMAVGQGANKGPGKSIDRGDRDSLIPVQRKPKPALDAGAIAMPEPDSN
jgi:hypothetical protein